MELDLKPIELPGIEKEVMIIAGPCSAETEEQVMDTATMLAKRKGITQIFRAGIPGNRVPNRGVFRRHPV